MRPEISFSHLWVALGVARLGRWNSEKCWFMYPSLLQQWYYKLDVLILTGGTSMIPFLTLRPTPCRNQLLPLLCKSGSNKAYNTLGICPFTGLFLCFLWRQQLGWVYLAQGLALNSHSRNIWWEKENFPKQLTPTSLCVYSLWIMSVWQDSPFLSFLTVGSIPLCIESHHVPGSVFSALQALAPSILLTLLYTLLYVSSRIWQLGLRFWILYYTIVQLPVWLSLYVLSSYFVKSSEKW